MLENGVRIPSLDGKDIFISNNCVNQKINEDGKTNKRSMKMENQSDLGSEIKQEF